MVCSGISIFNLLFSVMVTNMNYKKSLNPKKALIWRIVHRDNLPWILQNGFFAGNSDTRSENWIDIPFIFTDSHAYYMWSNFYSDIADLDKIDWEIIQSKDFKRDPDDPAKFERYQAEALIHNHCPIEALSSLDDVNIYIYEPTTKYQNVSKKKGVDALTPVQAMIAELVRRYWILGMECSLLEIQKLAWFLARELEKQGLPDILKLKFKANNYGPYAHNLMHLLNALDGSYLCSDKRIPDSDPLDVIRFNDAKKEKLQDYLITEAKDYLPVLEKTSELIEGFESPYGMELLATVDWLLYKEKCDNNIESIKKGLSHWKGGTKAAARKLSLFKDRHVSIAINRLTS